MDSHLLILHLRWDGEVSVSLVSLATNKCGKLVQINNRFLAFGNFLRGMSGFQQPPSYKDFICHVWLDEGIF